MPRAATTGANFGHNMSDILHTDRVPVKISPVIYINRSPAKRAGRVQMVELNKNHNTMLWRLAAGGWRRASSASERLMLYGPAVHRFGRGTVLAHMSLLSRMSCGCR